MKGCVSALKDILENTSQLKTAVLFHPAEGMVYHTYHILALGFGGVWVAHRETRNIYKTLLDLCLQNPIEFNQGSPVKTMMLKLLL